jgi:hypothetical protein
VNTESIPQKESSPIEAENVEHWWPLQASLKRLPCDNTWTSVAKQELWLATIDINIGLPNTEVLTLPYLQPLRTKSTIRNPSRRPCSLIFCYF